MTQQGIRLYGNLALRLAISAGILLFLFSRIDLDSLAAVFLGADPGLIILATVALGATFLLTSVRWWLLLKVQSIGMKWTVAARLTFVGLYFNNFLLGGFGGDLARAYYVMKAEPGRKIDAGFSIVADRFLGMFVLLCIVAVVVPWQYGFLLQRAETGVVIEVMIGVLLGAICVLGLLALLLRHRLLPFQERLSALVHKWEALVTLLRSVLSHHEAWETTLAAFLVSGIVAACTSVVGVLIARALNLDIDFPRMLVILAFVICMTALPISVAGHGVREASFVVMFAAFNVLVDGTRASQSHAVAFSLIYYALHLFWGLVGGIIFLAGDFRKPAISAIESVRRDLR